MSELDDHSARRLRGPFQDTFAAISVHVRLEDNYEALAIMMEKNMLHEVGKDAQAQALLDDLVRTHGFFPTLDFLNERIRVVKP